MMRVLSLIITIFLSVIPIFCQMPTNGDYTNWNWEDQNDNNWKRMTDEMWPDQTHKWDFITPAFSLRSGRVDRMDDIWKYEDYKKTGGWTLVYANFQYAKYPYFILYNKYRALMRVFFYRPEIANEAFSQFAITCSFNDKKPALFSYANEYKQATDKYYSNSATGNDILTMVVPQVPPKQWGCAEFTIFLDDNLVKEMNDGSTPKLYAGARMEILIFGVTTFDVNLKIGGAVVEVEDKGTTLQGGSYNPGDQKLEMINGKVLKEIKSLSGLASEALKAVNGINDTLETTPNYLKEYKKTMKPFYTDVENSLNSLGRISNTISVAFSLYKTIAGLMSPTTPPSVTSTFQEVTGTISGQAVVSGETFKIPGALIDQFQNKIPYYDCSMGLVNLNKTPKIKVTQPYLRRSSGYQRVECSDFHYDHTSIIKSDKYKKYKFEDEINLVVNTISGVNIIDKKFAIVIKSNENERPVYPVTFKASSCCNFIAGIPLCGGPHYYYSSYENPIIRSLNSGQFIYHKRDVDNPLNDLYGSPYLDYEQLKGFSFEAHSLSEVYLGVIVKFSIPNSASPVYFKALYQFDNMEVPYASAIVENNSEQQVFLLSDYYNGTVKIDLNNSQNSLFSAGTINLQPGFIGNPNFVATAIDPYPHSGLQPNIETLQDLCRNYPQLKSTYNHKEDLIKQQVKTENNLIEVYPNPTSGIFVINFNQIYTETPVIEIFNAYGQLVNTISPIKNTNLIEIDISEYAKGLYFIYIFDGNGTIVEKLLYK